MLHALQEEHSLASSSTQALRVNNGQIRTTIKGAELRHYIKTLKAPSSLCADLRRYCIPTKGNYDQLFI